MPNKNQLADVGHTAPVIKARAGIIFESDYIAYELRARTERTSRIVRCVKAYAKRPGCGSDGRAITDILADLRHYCASRGLDFHELDSAASNQHLEEEAYRN